MAAAALLLDLDGTLCDSRPWYAGVFADAHGCDRAVAMRRLEEGCPPMRLAESLRIGRVQFLRSCTNAVEQLQLYAGVHRTLEALMQRQTPVGLATGLSGPLAHLILDHHRLAPYFRAVRTPAWGTPAKPHPALLHQVMKDMRLQPGRDIYYVGDTEQDGGAARAAGLSFAWASYGYGAANPPDADAVLNEFPQVRTL